MKPPDLFKSVHVVAVEKYKKKGIVITEQASPQYPPHYFWFVCDRAFKGVLSDNTHDCGETTSGAAIARAKNVIDNFL